MSTPIASSNAQIASKLQKAIGGRPLAEIAGSVGYHPETTRRYVTGRSKVPAEFIGKVAAELGLDVVALLLERGAPEPENRRGLAADQLAALIPYLEQALVAISAEIRPSDEPEEVTAEALAIMLEIEHDVLIEITGDPDGPYNAIATRTPSRGGGFWEAKGVTKADALDALDGTLTSLRKA